MILSLFYQHCSGSRPSLASVAHADVGRVIKRVVMRPLITFDEWLAGGDGDADGVPLLRELHPLRLRGL